MYNNQFMLDNLTRQKERIDEMIKNYQNQTQTPVNNFINTNPQQMPSKNLIEWRILNETDEIDNLYVQNDTLFVGEETMIKKSVNGNLEKWTIKKYFPIDKKDEKISMLEEEIKKLKEMISSEHTKSNESINEINESNGDVDGVVESKSKTTSKSTTK